MSILTTVAELEALYGLPGEASTVKVTDRIIPEYRAFIDASPFVALADERPRGPRLFAPRRRAGFVRIHDERTLMMPDRRGNNRTDSLREHHPRPALRVSVPGAGFGDDAPGQRPRQCRHRRGALRLVRRRGKTPRSVIVMTAEAVYFQCARAIVRSDLWNPEKHVDPRTLPSPGRVLAALSADRVGGEDYDRAWPERAKATMW